MNTTPSPITAADVAMEDGWRDLESLAPADALLFDVLAGWGIWPDDWAPRPDEPLGEQFALQIGEGEAVEYTEVFDLIRHVAHAAFAAGAESVRGLPAVADAVTIEDAAPIDDTYGLALHAARALILSSTLRREVSRADKTAMLDLLGSRYPQADRGEAGRALASELAFREVREP